MNRKKWQGLTCFLLASLMMSSTFAAPVRNEAPNSTTVPKSTGAPQSTQMPKATTAPQATQTPKATTAPQATQMPKATTAPQATQVPKATTAPQATQVPKATTAPQATQTPQSTHMPSAKPSEVTPKPVMPCPDKKEEPKTTIVAPQQTTTPKAITAPQTDTTKKTENPCKKTCPNKPFTLDHFKMIVNTLKKMGVEEQEIVTYIKEGKKLEEILKTKRINPKKFKKCIIKEYYKAVDEAQKNGQITTEQAKQLKCAIKETIKNWLPKK